MAARFHSCHQYGGRPVFKDLAARRREVEATALGPGELLAVAIPLHYEVERLLRVVGDDARCP